MGTDRTAPPLELSVEPVHPGESGPAAVLPRHWLLWEDGAHDGVTNMASDHALMDTVQPGVGVWRWYGWAQPTVSFGRNERVAGRIHPAWLAKAGLAAVRRPTGGRALLHHRELTYSVTLPLPASGSWKQAYDAVNEQLLGCLLALGVPVMRAGAGPAVAPDGPVCFDLPAPGELTVEGRKLVGSAVWRQGVAYLQHGSILLHDDQDRLASVSGSDAPPPPAAALAHVLPGRSDDDLRRAVYAALRQTLQRSAEVQDFEPPVTWASHMASHRRHFADPAWLWRR